MLDTWWWYIIGNKCKTFAQVVKQGGEEGNNY
jgi:hypothetical protein